MRNISEVFLDFIRRDANRLWQSRLRLSLIYCLLTDKSAEKLI
jgi:hypothetical protein